MRFKRHRTLPDPRPLAARLALFRLLARRGLLSPAELPSEPETAPLMRHGLIGYRSGWVYATAKGMRWARAPLRWTRSGEFGICDGLQQEDTMAKRKGSRRGGKRGC